MSDRTQSSVRTEDSSAAADPETAAITPEEKSRPASGSGSNGKGAPATAPGWGGATPGTQQPEQAATAQGAAKPGGGTQSTAKPGGGTQSRGPQGGGTQSRAAQDPGPKAPPAGQAPAGPIQPAARPAGEPAQKPAQQSTKQSTQQPGRPAGQAAGGRPAGQRPAAGATVGAARQGAPQTGARPANRAAAGAPRQSADRPPSVGTRAAEGRAPEATEGERPAGKVRGSGRGPRRARLQLRHIDTWSALKISLVLAIALFFVWMVAVGVLYGVLNGLGVFATVNDLVGQLGSSSGDAGPSDVITPGVVFGGAAVIGAVNIVLFTALCTVGTFVYNLCSDLVGGLEVTLSERD